jgi:hypothetical protein
MKFTGKEGKHYTKEERANARQNHDNEHSHEPGYRKSVTFGNDFLKEFIDAPGGKAVTFEFATHADGRPTLIPVPVDGNGNEVPCAKPKGKKKPDVTTYDDPPHCPPQC